MLCSKWSLLRAEVRQVSCLSSLCRYFLLQRCWQHSPIDRPFFGSLQNDFEQMIDDPSKHVNLQLMEDEEAPGSLVQGVAHLFRPPPHLLDGTVQHSGRRTPLLQVGMYGNPLGVAAHGS